MSIISNNIRHLRKQKGLSQDLLAEELLHDAFFELLQEFLFAGELPDFLIYRTQEGGDFLLFGERCCMNDYFA